MNKKVLCTGLMMSMAATADMHIDNPLDFGEITVRNNSAVSTVSVSRSGTQQSTNQIYVLKAGSPAVITLSNMQPYMNINLSADVPARSNVVNANSAQFVLTAVDLPSSINTGSRGDVQFKMGGTLSTTGDGNHNYYSGANYQIFIDLHLDY